MKVWAASLLLGVVQAQHIYQSYSGIDVTTRTILADWGGFSLDQKLQVCKERSNCDVFEDGVSNYEKKFKVSADHTTVSYIKVDPEASTACSITPDGAFQKCENRTGNFELWQCCITPQGPQQMQNMCDNIGEHCQGYIMMNGGQNASLLWRRVSISNGKPITPQSAYFKLKANTTDVPVFKSFAPQEDFSGYIPLLGRDISAPRKIVGHLNKQSIDTLASECDALKNSSLSCDAFEASGYLRHYVKNVSVDSYVSQTKCNSNQAATLKDGYKACTGVDGHFESLSCLNPISTPQLAQLCDKHEECTGFWGAANGAQGPGCYGRYQYSKDSSYIRFQY